MSYPPSCYTRCSVLAVLEYAVSHSPLLVLSVSISSMDYSDDWSPRTQDNRHALGSNWSEQGQKVGQL